MTGACVVCVMARIVVGDGAEGNRKRSGTDGEERDVGNG